MGNYEISGKPQNAELLPSAQPFPRKENGTLPAMRHFPRKPESVPVHGKITGGYIWMAYEHTRMTHERHTDDTRATHG